MLVVFKLQTCEVVCVEVFLIVLLPSTVPLSPKVANFMPELLAEMFLSSIFLPSSAVVAEKLRSWLVVLEDHADPDTTRHMIRSAAIILIGKVSKMVICSRTLIHSPRLR
jgi:hypothetical protein